MCMAIARRMMIDQPGVKIAKDNSICLLLCLAYCNQAHRRHIALELGDKESHTCANVETIRGLALSAVLISYSLFIHHEIIRNGICT